MTGGRRDMWWNFRERDCFDSSEARLVWSRRRLCAGLRWVRIGKNAAEMRTQDSAVKTIASRTIVAIVAVPGWSAAMAQSYPARAIRVIVPFAPGGGTDILVRTIAPRLSEALGQQLVIDNRAGGGSTIGSELATKSPPDG